MCTFYVNRRSYERPPQPRSSHVEKTLAAADVLMNERCTQMPLFT